MIPARNDGPRTPVSALHDPLSWLICFCLVAGIWFAYGQVQSFEFVNYDDNEYIVDNQIVHQGLTLYGVKWAFDPANTRTANWHPVTWLSLMLDSQVFKE